MTYAHRWSFFSSETCSLRGWSESCFHFLLSPDEADFQPRARLDFTSARPWLCSLKPYWAEITFFSIQIFKKTYTNTTQTVVAFIFATSQRLIVHGSSRVRFACGWLYFQQWCPSGDKNTVFEVFSELHLNIRSGEQNKTRLVFSFDVFR